MRGRGMLIVGMVLVGLIVATLLIDRKVEAAKDLQATGNLSEYAEWILTRSAELEREHGK